MQTKKGLPDFRLAGILLVAIVLTISGCGKKFEPSINKDFMDLSVNPGDDFYRYANGNWIKNNQIPDDRSSYGSFDIVNKETDKNIRTLLEEVTKKTDAEKGSITQKIRDFYSTGMDTVNSKN
jgi:putative endopeptidase